MTPVWAYISVGKNFPTLANDKTAKRPIAVTDIKSLSRPDRSDLGVNTPAIPASCAGNWPSPGLSQSPAGHDDSQNDSRYPHARCIDKKAEPIHGLDNESGKSANQLSGQGH